MKTHNNSGLPDSGDHGIAIRHVIAIFGDVITCPLPVILSICQ